MRKINRRKFFAALRLLVGGGLTQEQVDGTNYLLDAIEAYGLTEPSHIACVAANVYHETGGYMMPIKETVMPYHKDKNPSDATVIARLNKAWKAGQLGQVSSPYWQAGWFGRGMIHITHQRNYEKMANRLELSLTLQPSLALDPAISANIAVVGMAEGLFTGKRLSDYLPGDYRGSRRIVNSLDQANKIATYCKVLEAGIEFSDHEVVIIPNPVNPNPPSTGWIEALVGAIMAVLKSIFGEKK